MTSHYRSNKTIKKGMYDEDNYDDVAKIINIFFSFLCFLNYLSFFRLSRNENSLTNRKDR